jgi:hypothetical protein
MSAVDDLTELIERAGEAERAALAARWRDRSEVEAMGRRVRRAIAEQRDVERRDTGAAVTGRRAELRTALLTGDPARPRPPRPADPPSADPASADSASVEAAQAEADAQQAVTIARLALLEAHLAVLDARLAHIDAGELGPVPGPDGRSGRPGANAVSRHGPALARGLRGEINYILTRKPRAVVRSLAVGLAMGLLYLGFIRVFEWDTKQRLLPYLGLFAISVVMGGAVCVNAMSFDAMRVRAALDGGARLWQLLVVKNAALTVLVAPVGFLLSAALAWRAGNLGAFFIACALVVSIILLWLGVGNVLSVLLPIRDEPLRERRRSGTLKQFVVAFAVAYAIGYLVNFMLLWRVLAARELAARLGGPAVPAVLVVVSSAAMWLLLTVFAMALAQQPKIRRILLREIADYGSNAEARAFARESRGSDLAMTGSDRTSSAR